MSSVFHAIIYSCFYFNTKVTFPFVGQRRGGEGNFAAQKVTSKASVQPEGELSIHFFGHSFHEARIQSSSLLKLDVSPPHMQDTGNALANQT